MLDGASNASLDNEFGTHNIDDCIVKILERGTFQTYTVSLLSKSAGIAYGKS